MLKEPFGLNIVVFVKRIGKAFFVLMLAVKIPGCGISFGSDIGACRTDKLDVRIFFMDPSFKDLFVEGIKSFILADGEIDDEETEFLCQQISADGEIDENEKALLEALAAEVELPEELADMLD